MAAVITEPRESHARRVIKYSERMEAASLKLTVCDTSKPAPRARKPTLHRNRGRCLEAFLETDLLLGGNFPNDHFPKCSSVLLLESPGLLSRFICFFLYEDAPSCDNDTCIS